MKPEEIEKTLSVADKQQLIRNKRSMAERIYARAVREGKKLAPGAGKGLEPKPWCACHNRNPCPIEIELNL